MFMSPKSKASSLCCNNTKLAVVWS